MGYHYSHFFAPPIQFSCPGCKYCISNTLETLKSRLLTLEKNGRSENWSTLFHFHNYLVWVNICHYGWKFKIQKVEWIVYSAEKRKKISLPNWKVKCYQYTTRSLVRTLIKSPWPCRLCIFSYLLEIWISWNIPSLPLLKKRN